MHFMIPFRKTIGFRLLVASFILLALPLLIDSLILTQQEYADAIHGAKRHLVDVGYVRQIPLAQMQPFAKPLTPLLNKFLELDKGVPEESSESTNNKLAELAKEGDYFGVYLMKITKDEHIVIVGASDPTYVGKDYTDLFKLNSPFTEAAIERGYTNYFLYENEMKEPYIITAHVLLSKENKPEGLIAISRDIGPYLAQYLAADKYLYTLNFGFLIPPSLVFAASDPSLRFQYFLPLADEFKELFFSVQPGARTFLPPSPLVVDRSIGFPFFQFKWRGEDQIAYIEDVPEGNFSLLVYASRDDVLQATLEKFFNIYSIYLIVLFFGLPVAYFATKRLTKPIQKLSQVMQQTSEGNLAVRFQDDFVGFEINELGHVYNQMIDSLLAESKAAEAEKVKKEQYLRELRLGREVQRNLFPKKMLTYPGVELAAMYVPAIEVGGDYYDLFLRKVDDHEELVLAIADASGKGVRACFYSLSVRNILRTYAKKYPNIAQAMAATNNLFLSDTGETGMFVTLLAGVYDYRTHNFSYYSSGHNPGLLLKKSGEIEELSCFGIAMGVIPCREDINAHTLTLEKGDTIIFYTDGITEACDLEEKLYGMQRFTASLEKNAGKSAEEIVKAIIFDVNNFVGEASQHDDITLLVMRVVEE